MGRRVPGTAVRATIVLAFGVTGLLALVCGEAAGGPGAASVRFRYVLGRGAEQCPDIGAMREAVAARLGYVPWHPAGARTILVAVAADGGGLRARVELRDGAGSVTGVRELFSPSRDCNELTAAVELAISIAIDPLSLTRRPPPPAPAHDREPVPEPGRAAPRNPRTAAGEGAGAERLQISASVGGLVAFGSAPAVAGGVTFQGRLRKRAASVALEGRVDLPAYRDALGGQVSSSLILGSVQGCYHRWHLMGCGIFAAGALRAAGHQLADAESHTVAYLAGGLRLGGELPLFSVLALRVHADLLVPFTRVTLRTTASQEEIWSTPAVSGALGLALLGRFL
jgi:hypothetical protein